MRLCPNFKECSSLSVCPLSIKFNFPYANPVNLSEQYYWLTATEKFTFQQVDLPGVLVESEDPGGKGRSARGTGGVRRPWWQG